MSSITVNRIKHINLLHACRRRALELIDGLSTTVALPPGQTLYSQGEPASEFFVLLDGVVDVRKAAQTIARLHGGGWFGETALIHNVDRQASIITATASTVAVFNRREFNSLCAEAPSVRARLEDTAALYLRGEQPLIEEWYEPVAQPAASPTFPRTTTRQPPNAARPSPRQKTERARRTINSVP
jgi:CRP-like cAMP-binding protein